MRSEPWAGRPPPREYGVAEAHNFRAEVLPTSRKPGKMGQPKGPCSISILSLCGSPRADRRKSLSPFHGFLLGIPRSVDHALTPAEFAHLVQNIFHSVAPDCNY